ncbi:unnamed protein product [Heterobilharzia americana]|nr:unnamed protein product [Heterobilharzia americana]
MHYYLCIVNQYVDQMVQVLEVVGNLIDSHTKNKQESYRRDCTLTSSSKDNYDKGPLENVNKSVVDGINKLENDNIQQPANNHIQKNESLIENSDPKQPSIVETNNSQLQYEPEIKHTKSTLPSTFNRHMWVNTCPTSVFLNNRSTKILNMDISTSKVNHIKQRRMKKESPFASKTCLSQPNTGKLNDVNVTNNNSNLLSIPCNKSVTRLNIESSREGINLHQLIRDANQPGFWPLLYKKLLELQATQSNMIEEDMNMKMLNEYRKTSSISRDKEQITASFCATSSPPVVTYVDFMIRQISNTHLLFEFLTYSLFLCEFNSLLHC